jgi:hypothetical protein
MRLAIAVSSTEVSGGLWSFLRSADRFQVRVSVLGREPSPRRIRFSRSLAPGETREERGLDGTTVLAMRIVQRASLPESEELLSRDTYYPTPTIIHRGIEGL